VPLTRGRTAALCGRRRGDECCENGEGEESAHPR
jgi:hypothetical protein